MCKLAFILQNTHQQTEMFHASHQLTQKMFKGGGGHTMLHFLKISSSKHVFPKKNAPHPQKKGGKTHTGITHFDW